MNMHIWFHWNKNSFIEFWTFENYIFFDRNCLNVILKRQVRINTWIKWYLLYFVWNLLRGKNEIQIIFRKLIQLIDTSWMEVFSICENLPIIEILKLMMTNLMFEAVSKAWTLFFNIKKLKLIRNFQDRSLIATCINTFLQSLCADMLTILNIGKICDIYFMLSTSDSNIKINLLYFDFR